jgi:hypothetical protein
MSQLTIVNRSQLLAAATAIAALGLLVTGSPPAQAHPMLPFPLAPDCSQWGFPGNVSIFQTGAIVITFNSTGPVAKGVAKAKLDNGEQMIGNISGGIQGDKLDFTIRWDGNAGLGHYTGVVTTTTLPSGQVPGDAYGDTVDENNPSSTGSWFTEAPLVCTTPAAPPPAAAPPPPPPPLIGGLPADTVVTPFPNRRSVPPLTAGQQGPTATVISDVDIYDAPGGNGNKIGILRSGRQVPLVGSCKPNDWCDVVIPELPGGSGWVWDQFLKF